MIVSKISLETAKNGVQKNVFCKSGETAARELIITLTANGNIIPLSVDEEPLFGCLAYMYDAGTGITSSINPPVIENASLVFSLPPAMPPGEKIIEFKLTGNAGAEVVYSPQFRIMVEKSLDYDAIIEAYLSGIQYEEKFNSSQISELISADDYAVIVDKTTGSTKLISLDDIPVEWSNIGNKPTTLAGYGITDAYTKNETDENLDKKVDKVEGKDLSENDYTDSDKNKVAESYAAKHTHSNKALLDTYSQTENDLADAVNKKHTHSNKAILDATTVPFTTSDKSAIKINSLEIENILRRHSVVDILNTYEDLEEYNTSFLKNNDVILVLNDNGYICSAFRWDDADDEWDWIGNAVEKPYTKSEIVTLLSRKVDKVTGKGLSSEDYTAADKSKLAGISANAKNVSVSASGTATDTVGYISIDGVEKKLAGGSTEYTTKVALGITPPAIITVDYEDGYGWDDLYSAYQDEKKLSVEINTEGLSELELIDGRTIRAEINELTDDTLHAIVLFRTDDGSVNISSAELVFYSDGMITLEHFESLAFRSELEAQYMPYDNTESGLEAATVQGAIDEVADDLGGKLDTPTGGSVGDVLKKTADGEVWDALSYLSLDDRPNIDSSKLILESVIDTSVEISELNLGDIIKIPENINSQVTLQDYIIVSKNNEGVVVLRDKSLGQLFSPSDGASRDADYPNNRTGIYISNTFSQRFSEGILANVLEKSYSYSYQGNSSYYDYKTKTTTAKIILPNKSDFETNFIDALKTAKNTSDNNTARICYKDTVDGPVAVSYWTRDSWGHSSGAVVYKVNSNGSIGSNRTLGDTTNDMRPMMTLLLDSKIDGNSTLKSRTVPVYAGDIDTVQKEFSLFSIKDADARSAVEKIKDGTNIESFADVEKALDEKESLANKVTVISDSSTDDEYPSAKAVYDLVGDVDAAISSINAIIGGAS